MRHDAHFVESLASPRGEPVGCMVSINRIVPNPEQPRKEFGGVEELASSIQEKGVLAPILVRRVEGGQYQVIAGERRYRACVEAGLTQIPCIEMEVDQRGVLELSLVENLQRQDLSAFEEADAISILEKDYRYTHEAIARKLGKARSTVTEMLTIASMPLAIREECRHADIRAKSLLLEVAKCPDTASQVEMVGRIRDQGLQRAEARALKKDRKAPSERRRPFVFKYQPKDRAYRIQLRFRKSTVEREEVIVALRNLVASLEAESGEAWGET